MVVDTLSIQKDMGSIGWMRIAGEVRFRKRWCERTLLDS